MVLDAAFYQRDTLTVARDLIGQSLCRETAEGIVRLTITEVEAYDGPEDRACHARAGRTRRTEPMFAAGGIWYVYLCYGIHWLANIVTGPEEYPAAVLLRGAGSWNGPGRLTKALGVTGDLNHSTATPASGFWIEAGRGVRDSAIERTPRIGVDYAGSLWANKPYRFVLKDRCGAQT